MIEINSTGKVGRWVDSLVEGAKDFNKLEALRDHIQESFDEFRKEMFY